MSRKHYERICSGRSRREQRTAQRHGAPHRLEGMNDEKSIPQFGPEARRALLHERVLVLDGALDDDNGALLMTQLLTLSAEDPVDDIALWIHSPGGSVPAMLAIRDIMRLIPNDVSTLALGLACSAASPCSPPELTVRVERCRTRESSCTRDPLALAAWPSRSKHRQTICVRRATPCWG